MKMWKKTAAVVAAVALSATIGAVTAAAIGNDNPPAADTGARTPSNLLGNGVSENKYVPIVPCRILDTRKGYGKLPVATLKTIDVRGSETTFTTQGGNPGGCGIPSGATAIEATFTAVDAQSGFLRAWPAGLSQPNATFLNYDDAFNVSNTGTVTLCGSTGLSCVANKDLNLTAYGNPTDLVIDVAGYYMQPMSANVGADGALVRSSRATSASHPSTGSYRVIFDRNIDQCTYFAGTATADGDTSDGFVTVTNYGINDKGVFVQTFDASGTKVDRGFQVEVVC